MEVTVYQAQRVCPLPSCWVTFVLMRVIGSASSEKDLNYNLLLFLSLLSVNQKYLQENDQGRQKITPPPDNYVLKPHRA